MSKASHVVFVGYKYTPWHPTKSVCTCENWLWSSLSRFPDNTSTFSVFYADEHEDIGGDLISFCMDEKPDVIVLFWGVSAPPRYNVPLESLVAIRERLRCAIVSVWNDTWSRWLSLLADSLTALSDLAIVTDSISHVENSAFFDRYVNLVPCPDLGIFQNPGKVRDIAVSFNGSVDAFPDRRHAVEHLRERGIEVRKSGGLGEESLSLEDYADIYKRSLITLSFHQSGERTTLKGRVFEATLCGAALAAPDCPELTRLFAPGRDFIAFSDLDDLARKIDHHLDDRELLARIAANGQRRARQLVGEFWPSVLAARHSNRTADNQFYQAILGTAGGRGWKAGDWNEIDVLTASPSDIDWTKPFTLRAEMRRRDDDLKKGAYHVVKFLQDGSCNGVSMMMDNHEDRPLVCVHAPDGRQTFLAARPGTCFPGQSVTVVLRYDGKDLALCVNGIPADATDRAIPYTAGALTFVPDAFPQDKGPHRIRSLAWLDRALDDPAFFACGWNSP